MKLTVVIHIRRPEIGVFEQSWAIQPVAHSAVSVERSHVCLVIQKVYPPTHYPSRYCDSGCPKAEYKFIGLGYF